MKEIKKYLESRIGQHSFYFEDLEGGYVYGYNENVQMISAGCMKLPIAIAILKEAENGKFDLKDKVTVFREDKVSGTGIIHEFGEREYNLSELLIAMLIQSDNTAANKLIDMIGMPRINELFQEMSLKNTVINRKILEEKDVKNVVQNITSSYDLCLCWKHLYKHSYLNEEHSKMVIDILKRQQMKNKVAFYIPEDIKKGMANKTGDLSGVENDTALIQISKGNFAFTVMSQGIPNNVYGNITLAKCGKMMWDMLINSWN
ncbi:class A beta-lactamase-related serine hydrolase [Clostridium sp. MSJ-4]|uniref:Class A beta-lactamase-related serine hydrolase n=1 Tax=Clostridium simiarum TaxID=2841506 RepID=A0ABS6EXK1_9CLOT|nr:MULTISPECIES: serine hydrolase [Clostridium]MBU5590450.1 class A beta-lactamase-related serine hydrolase [Clostridium simiarum]